MRHRFAAIVMNVYLMAWLCAGVTTTAAAAATESPPDEAVVRRAVEATIQQAPNHQATLGMLQAAMELSISFGAPAWNAGDHDACCRFYVKTAESLCATFAAANSASAPAREALDDLKSALDRVHQSTEVDGNAWTMRYVFDKTAAISAVQAGRSVQMLALGQQCAARSRFQDAELAYTAAVAAMKELDGQPAYHIPPACRYSPLALSEALFAQRQYVKAAAAAREGLRYLPDWPTSNEDIRKHFLDPALYALLFDDLKENAAKHPDDASLQFLFGYQLFFTGHKDAAKPYFQHALKIDPSDAASKRMMQEYDGSYQREPLAPTPGGGSQA